MVSPLYVQLHSVTEVFAFPERGKQPAGLIRKPTFAPSSGKTVWLAWTAPALV